MNNDLPYIPLSDSALEEYLQILRVGNTLTAKWADKIFGSRSIRKLRLMVHTGKSVATLVEKSDRAEFFDDLPKMKATQLCEEPVLLSHTNLAYDIAWRLRGRATRTMLTLDDIKQESIIGLREAIFHYTRPNIKFCTFAGHCCMNTITTAIVRVSPLGQFTKQDRKLFIRFKKEQIRCSTDDDFPFEEVCRRLGLNAEQAETISQMEQNVSFVSGKAQREKENDGGGCKGDYTSDRVGAYSDTSGIPKDDFEFWEAIDALHLEPFERDVVESAMFRQHGWQAQVARDHVNPKTKRPYTRQAVFVVLKRVSNRLRYMGFDIPEISE